MKIKQLEKEIEETKEKLLTILRPFYYIDLDDSIEIKGKDFLFYGDCCQIEAKLSQAKEDQELVDKFVKELKDKFRGSENVSYNVSYCQREIDKLQKDIFE